MCIRDRRHTDAVVLDGKLVAAKLREAVRFFLDRKGDVSSIRGVLDSVAHQVHKDLLDAQAVAADKMCIRDSLTADGSPVYVRLYKKDAVDTDGTPIWIMSVQMNWAYAVSYTHLIRDKAPGNAAAGSSKAARSGR